MYIINKKKNTWTPHIEDSSWSEPFWFSSFWKSIFKKIRIEHDETCKKVKFLLVLQFFFSFFFIETEMLKMQFYNRLLILSWSGNTSAIYKIDFSIRNSLEGKLVFSCFVIGFKSLLLLEKNCYGSCMQVYVVLHSLSPLSPVQINKFSSRRSGTTMLYHFLSLTTNCTRVHADRKLSPGKTFSAKSLILFHSLFILPF